MRFFILAIAHPVVGKPFSGTGGTLDDEAHQ